MGVTVFFPPNQHVTLSWIDFNLHWMNSYFSHIFKSVLLHIRVAISAETGLINFSLSQFLQNLRL